MSEKHDHSLSEVHSSVEVGKKGWRKLFSFLGPAYLVSVGYMDPGNWATDLAGGSRYGYALIWVLLMSNLMAVLLQSLSARLGIVRGRDLAQANRETYPKFLNFILYGLAEIAIAATDLAEVLGMAIGIQLLTGLPLIWGVAITILDTFLLLYLQKLGMRKMEAFIISLVAVIAGCFLIEILLAKPSFGEIASGLRPSFPDETALYIAIGIIGATVMPHNLYLHSALVQTRKIDRTEKGIRQALKFNLIDSAVALNIAFLVNAAILILAATVFFKTGNSHVGEIKEAHRLLPSFLGDLAPFLFAIALIAAGQSSTVTGTLAGQIVMEGYLHLRINPILRRLLTRLIAILPAALVIGYYGESKVDDLLVFSQVVLSLQLGFAIIPLIHFVSDKKKMGSFAIGPITAGTSWIIALVLIYLNARMLYNEIHEVYQYLSGLNKILILAATAFFGFILLYITLYPFKRKRRQQREIGMHLSSTVLNTFDIPNYRKIAVALDFSENDSKLISNALRQGNADTEYLLLHVTESASAGLSGTESDDLETRYDKERLENYREQLTALNKKVTIQLGYRYRVKEIIRITTENNAELLVMGGHGHKGIKDFIYGETVDAVRHGLKIPVLIVNL